MQRLAWMVLLALAVSIAAPAARAGTSFIYQGELTNNQVPANGNFDFRFILYSTDVGGSQIGPIVTLPGVAVAQGVFTVPLDFGTVFGTAEPWLDIAVKPAGGPAYTPLSPRQPVTPAPRAMALSLPYADSVDLPSQIALSIDNVSGGAASFSVSGNEYWDAVQIHSDSLGGGLRSVVQAPSQGSAVSGYNYGTERGAAQFEIYNAANERSAMFVRTNGDGYAIQAEVNADTMGTALFARTTSTVSGSLAATFGGPVVMSCQSPNCNAAHALRVYGNTQVVGTLSKSAGSFRIDHPLDPENKTLSHSFVESPDMKNLYDGVATLDASGSAWIEMPDWFEALNQSFRYQLTAIGASSPGLYVSEEIAGNRFAIAGGAPGARVSWQVTGSRHDAYAKAFPIPLEEDKVGDERGRYLVPEAFGQSPERAIGWRPQPDIEATQPAPAAR
ncbi:MAG TPA: hypothetical protein VIZ64_14125 [Dokdonella sp.]